MEAIGLLASVAQLADYTGTFLLNLYQYYVDINDAAKCADELRTQVGLSLSLLNALHQILPKSLLTQPEYSRLERSLNAVLELFETYNEKIKPENAKGRRILTWPFKKQEIRTLVSSLQEKNTTFQWALTHVQMSGLLLYLLTL